jgi:hypothetical protein
MKHTGNIFRVLKRLKYSSSYHKASVLNSIRWSWKKTEDHNYYYGLTDQNYLYLTHFLCTTFRCPFDEIEGYLDEIRSDLEIKSILSSSFMQNNDLRDSIPEIGRRVGWYVIVRILKPKLVVESGVYQGLGSLIISKAIEKNVMDGYGGRYIGTDIDPDSGVFYTGRLTNFGEIRIGDSIQILNSINSVVDLYICDSDHSSIYELKEYQALEFKIDKSSVVISDNSHATDVLANWSLKNNREFHFFRENPKDHWYPGGGIGISKSPKS